MEAFQGVPVTRLGPTTLAPPKKKLWSTREIRSARLGLPKLGKHHVPPLHTGRTGVCLAAPRKLGLWSFTNWGEDTENP